MMPQTLTNIMGFTRDEELFEYVRQSATSIRQVLQEGKDTETSGVSYISLEKLYASSLSEARSGEDYFLVWAHTPEGKAEVKQWWAFYESVYTHFTAPPLLRELLTHGTRLRRNWVSKKAKHLSARQQIILAYIRRVNQSIDTVPQQAVLVMTMYYECHRVILSNEAMFHVTIILALEKDESGGMKALVDRLMESMSSPWMP